ncbi:MAG: hypothetical protein GTN38_04105 [Candidatus Aenigmarchaeota archaeon]|nr:hypothetical protein [Candidatus Aenigmarchaeota archaeon]NIP40844.1 hypothetical protein [Candidatus Aenigmarchaeota archaeon]NIQ17958.1 hypothetical protein [Candidatus Aenigmarchaeota archaeon]NIS73547.1 hypothetical protein [Candidatus Aenigmarchaeota archaeon]
MKKYTKIGVFLFFLPFIMGCQQETKEIKEYSAPAKQETQEYPAPVRTAGHPGSGEYKITQSMIQGVRPRVHFKRYEFTKDDYKTDIMLIWDGDNEYVYLDRGCDNTVDMINLRHKRGDPGTEEMFEYADKTFAKWKKELHEKSTH